MWEFLILILSTGNTQSKLKCLKIKAAMHNSFDGALVLMITLCLTTTIKYTYSPHSPTALFLPSKLLRSLKTSHHLAKVGLTPSSLTLESQEACVLSFLSFPEGVLGIKSTHQTWPALYGEIWKAYLLSKVTLSFRLHQPNTHSPGIHPHPWSFLY